MGLQRRRNGASTPLIAIVVVALVAIAGAAVLLYSGMGGNAPTISSSSSTSSSSSSGSIRAVLALQPGTPLASTDVVANYSMTLTMLGEVASPLTVSASSPEGVQVEFIPPQFQPAGGVNTVAVSFSVGSSVAPGTYPFNVTLTSPDGKYIQRFQVEVVKYLVVTVGTRFLPSSLSVPVGSTVHWMRLNGAIDQYDNGDHNVAFRTIGVTSPTMAQYQDYSYIFSQAGTYQYYCTFHPSMVGEITAT